MKSCRKDLDFVSWLNIQRLGGSFPAAFLFLHFLSISSIFSAAKHPSEDDNSEDGWLDRFSP